MCQKPEGRGQKKLCPLSPPHGHLTTVALSVQCHIPLAKNQLLIGQPALLSKCLFSIRSHDDSWLRKSFAFDLLPRHRLLVEDRGMTQDPRVYICCSDCSFIEYFQPSVWRSKNRQQDFVSKAAFLHSKPYTVL